MGAKRDHVPKSVAEDLFVYETKHRITYNTKKPVPIRDVVAALQGLDRLLTSVPAIVTGLTGVEIERSVFNLEGIESGSLIEDIFVQFFFKDRESLDAFVKKAGGNKHVKGTVVAVAIAGAIGYGLHWAGSSKPSPNITATNNVIINIGAGEMRMTPEAFEAVVRSAVSSKKDAAQDAIKFLAPARGDESSTVVIGGADGVEKFKVPAAAITETPKKLDLGKNDRIEELSKTDIQIRATDLDSKKTGWAGKVEGKTERVRIELDPTVSENEMFGKTKVTADAALIFEPRGKGLKLTPTKIYIRKIY